jgi:hypothetical protein
MSLARWAWRIVAIVTIALPVIVVILDAIGVGAGPTFAFHVLYGATTIVFAVVGWLIIERRPGNVIGPLLVLFALPFALYLAADQYVHLPGDLPGTSFAAVFISTLDAPMFVLIGLILVLFPDGRPLPGRWAVAVPLAIGCIVVGVVGALLTPGPIEVVPGFVNPIGVPGFPGRGLVLVTYLGVFALLVLAVASLVIRWRRGITVEREQIKWVALATAILLIAEIVNVATFRADDPNSLAAILSGLTIALVPISMGIAILRYRLYEIDRIISRTVGYGVVTALLGAVFLSSILLLQAALDRFTQGGTIAVAVSTLAVFALFQPLRRRVQAAVDRRFDRARYDADRTAEAFAGRLRDETDMATVTSDLAATANATVAPRSLSIWLRPSRVRQ